MASRNWYTHLSKAWYLSDKIIHVSGKIEEQLSGLPVYGIAGYRAGNFSELILYGMEDKTFLNRWVNILKTCEHDLSGSGILKQFKPHRIYQYECGKLKTRKQINENFKK